MNRRQLLRYSAFGAIAAGGAVVGSRAVFPPGPSSILKPVDELAVELFDSMDHELRDRVCVAYDHPLRQYHNRGVWSGGVSINAANFNRHQRHILNDLYHAGVSAQGRQILHKQFFNRWLGVQTLHVLMAGDPHTEDYQVMLSGPHLNLRLGGRSREGVAFGGPQIYGDQRGNERQGLPGNVYRYQFVQGRDLFNALSDTQKADALIDQAPVQTQIELQGEHGEFAGIAVSSLASANQQRVVQLIDSILEVYPPQDSAYAKECIARNGGVNHMYLSYYQEGEVGASGEYQIFRLEGPASVFYFRGHPHVHAFINVGMDGNQPLSVGELLGENPERLVGTQVKALFERAMRYQMQADFAFYDENSVAGNLRKGPIRSGDIYNLESWVNNVVSVVVKGNQLGGALRDQLQRQQVQIDPMRAYTVATTNYLADEYSYESFGQIEAINRSGILLRDAAIDFLKAHPFDWV